MSVRPTRRRVAIFHYEYYSSHTGLLIRQPATLNPDGCNRSDFYILRKEHPHYKEITALILASYFADRPLAFYLIGCYQDLPSIEHVYSDR